MNSIERGTPVDLLQMKLVAWLQQQPEYVEILQMDRQQRRASQRALADRLFQHITVPADTQGLNRASKRTIARRLSDAEKRAKRQEEARQRRIARAIKTLAEDGALEQVVEEGAAQQMRELTPDEAAKAANELMFVETDETVEGTEVETVDDVPAGDVPGLVDDGAGGDLAVDSAGEAGDTEVDDARSTARVE